METKNIVSNPKNIIISGGGTGGHLFPALAIRDEIVNRYPNTIIHYIGSQFGIEKDVQRSKEQKHASINPPSSRIHLNLPLPPIVHTDQGQLEHVDENCPKDEKEVNQNPKGKGCYALSNLLRPYMLIASC